MLDGLALESLKLYLPVFYGSDPNRHHVVGGSMAGKIVFQVAEGCLWITPSLQKLNLSGLRAVTGRELLHSFPMTQHGSSSVTGLIFEDCNYVPGPTLEHFLLSSRTLKRFVFEVCTHINFARPVWYFSVTTYHLYHGLSAHKDSLEELVISQGYHETSPPDWRLGSLADFTRLKRLALPRTLLFQDRPLHSLLPPNLEEMQLHYSNAMIAITPFGIRYERRLWLQDFGNLAGLKILKFPRLKAVSFWHQHYIRKEPAENGIYWSGYGSKLELQAIEEHFEVVRVEFDFRETLNFKETIFGRRFLNLEYEVQS
jgi:hypothetical protein